MQCCMAWYYAIYVSLNDLLLIKLLEKEAFVSAWLAGSATCDILITVSLVYIVSPHLISLCDHIGPTLS